MYKHNYLTQKLLLNLICLTIVLNIFSCKKIDKIANYRQVDL